MGVFPADKDLQPLIKKVATGSDEQLEQQLFRKSREPNILRFTPKDSSKRFGDKEMFDKWRSEGRELYWLLGEDDDLAGVIWYGKKAAPLKVEGSKQPSDTFAIRIYDGYSGHGLAVPAMRQTLRIHVEAAQKKGEPVSGIWLETDTDNPAALKVYTKFGYHEVHRTDKRVTMVLPASEIARITGA